MRSLPAILLAPVALLTACATPPPPPCEYASVPPGAVFGVRESLDIATYPPRAPTGASGCQRVWYGPRERPEAMQVLATYYFEHGDVRRLVGRVPGGAEYDCHYRDGRLDFLRSRNQAQCPAVTELQR